MAWRTLITLWRNDVNTYQRLFAITALILIGVFITAPLFADPLELIWTNPTTRTDGAVFVPDTELASIEIGCGTALAGPFDVFTHQVLKVDGLPAPTNFSTQDAPSDLVACVAFVVDTGGVISDQSNVHVLDYTAPISGIQDLGQRCYGSCPGVVNFNIYTTPPAP
ncbi:MAG: hypothetical protein AB2792_01875 [Candidatus Thiodiazotropha sp.]